jgi:N-formylglutamate deformylase
LRGRVWGKVKLYYIYFPTKKRIPVVASLPHSGMYIPRTIARQFKRDPRPVLTTIDWHLEKLYDFLPAMGITVIQATHNKYVVNLNRGLSPPLFGPEMMSVVSSEGGFESALYKGELNQGEIEERINKYYLPYHRRLERILHKVVRDFHRVYLLDLHSFCTESPKAEVCLGDANGTTCTERLTACFEGALRRYDFDVVRNDRWTGGYITRHYGSLANVETLQVEIRFSAYLERQYSGKEEITEWDTEKFRRARQRLKRAFAEAIKSLLADH